MKKVYLHIGAGKTGTSAIQSGLSLNRENLKYNNYFYPISDTDYKADNLQANPGNAKELGYKLQNGSYDELSTIILQYIKDSNDNHILLSSEMLQAYNEEQSIYLKNIFNEHGYEVIIIFYIRAIADHIVSSYHQSLKRRNNTHDIKNRIRKKNNRFLYDIEKSIKIFGKNNLVVKNYDKVKDNIIRDFLQDVLDINDISKFEIPNKKINRSLSIYEVSLMKNINTYFTNNQHSTFVSDALIHNKPNLSYEMILEKKDLEILEEMYSEDINILNTFLKEKEQPLTLVDNLKIVDIDKPVVFNAFQESVFAILAELVKEVKK